MPCSFVKVAKVHHYIIPKADCTCVRGACYANNENIISTSTINILIRTGARSHSSLFVSEMKTSNHSILK